jgi:hypothetical protein
VIENTDLSRNKIINLDEDDIIDYNDSRNMIGGTCLLPPIEAKIAEVDGDEQKYDMLYTDYLLQPFQQQFISAIIAFLYKGGNLILFLPDFDYTNTTKKLVQIMYQLYGIHIGIIECEGEPILANCYYDEKCMPIWLNLIYTAGVISPEEYLVNYPIDAQLNNEHVIGKLLCDLSPMGDTYAERVKTIERFRRNLHKNPKIEIPIRRIE